MKYTVLFIFMLLFAFVATAQTSALISEDFVISINSENSKIPQSVLVDVSDLHFANEEDLQKFCKTFSFDFHQLSGNFEQNAIKITLNDAYLNSKSKSLEDVNAYFERLSNRMSFYFNKL